MIEKGDGRAEEKASFPVRVLQINAGNRDFGGVSSFLFNTYSNIDKTKVQFDFLSPNISTYEIRRGDIEGWGGRIFAFGIDKAGIAQKLSFSKKLKEFLRCRSYRIVQINSGSYFFNLITACAAKRAGIPAIIVHSHSVMADNVSGIKRVIIKLTKFLLAKLATDYFACSEEAAGFMFPSAVMDRVRIIHSGMDIDRFVFSPASREAMRKSCHFENSFVIGHVGRFDDVKNQIVLVQMMPEIVRRVPGAVLVLVGEGDTESRVKQEADRSGLDQIVYFPGLRNDVEKFYQMFDCFAFPSSYEGLGMALVEAQVSGLPCVASDRVPKETDISNNVTYLPVGDTERWIDAICRIAENPVIRSDYRTEAENKGYSIDSISRDLEDFYLSKTAD